MFQDLQCICEKRVSGYKTTGYIHAHKSISIYTDLNTELVRLYVVIMFR